MKISIDAPPEAKRNGFQNSVMDRIRKTLTRFSNRITRVDVTITDENGPRGGVDKRCRISLVMPGFGQIATSAKHENPWAAVAQASDRARRILLTKLKRPKTRRMRRYTSCAIRLPADLVLLATRDGLGSVSRKVVSDAKYSVLTVR